MYVYIQGFRGTKCPLPTTSGSENATNKSNAQARRYKDQFVSVPGAEISILSTRANTNQIENEFCGPKLETKDNTPNQPRHPPDPNYRINKFGWVDAFLATSSLFLLFLLIQDADYTRAID